MAKSNSGNRSVLKLAYEAFQRGDAVLARQLGQAVLAGKVGRDDEKVAGELAKEFSTDEAPIEGTPAAVAQELVSRTIVPPRPYIFVAAVAGTFLGLVLLAHFRYS